jgi:hypothetical protein
MFYNILFKYSIKQQNNNNKSLKYIENKTKLGNEKEEKKQENKTIDYLFLNSKKQHLNIDSPSNIIQIKNKFEILDNIKIHKNKMNKNKISPIIDTYIFNKNLNLNSTIHSNSNLKI